MWKRRTDIPEWINTLISLERIGQRGTIVFRVMVCAIKRIYHAVRNLPQIYLKNISNQKLLKSDSV